MTQLKMSMPKKRIIKFNEAINEAMFTAMNLNKKVLCFGLGVDDPKRIFNTTKNLKEKFGSDRVFDTPTSENAMTGVGIGMSLKGYYPVMVHQRLDFFLLAMDQLVNSAAKWHYMFGGQQNIPITIRLIVGRGWGQGPTHSQSLHSWFAHIPGLKVVMPSSARDAKGLLLSSIFDKNPVIFIEHRWLHNTTSEVPVKKYLTPISKPKIIKKGSDITLICISYMTIEAIRAVDFLEKENVSVEIIDLRTISPINYSIITNSIKKTGRFLVLDIGNEKYGVASEIISTITIKLYKYLKNPPNKITLPHIPTPTSFGLTKDFYPTYRDIIFEVLKMLKKKTLKNKIPVLKNLHDVPGNWFTGPF